MKVKFLGAAQTVTGSCYWLSSGKTKLLIDFGLFQGAPEDAEWNQVKPGIEFDQLSAVIVTHAHLDHCGRLPLLVKFGFQGPIYMTGATKALTELVLYDSAKLAKEEVKDVLYTDEDVDRVMAMVELVEYGDEFTIGDFRVTYVDAGHILGSASVIFEEWRTGKIITFSGDLGNTPEPLLFPTHFIEKSDAVVIESTYGDRLHGPGNEVEVIAGIMAKAERENSVVLIPTFSLQRAQELLYIFDQLKKNGRVKNETPVFLDSPMAIKATEVFRQYPSLYSRKLQVQVKKDDPFDFPGLVVCSAVEKSKAIKEIKGVKVIIAGSGMMTGGRIIHHLVDYLGIPSTQLIFVGYQAQGTLGKAILDGLRSVNVYGQWVEVAAQIKEIKTMSAHADQAQLVDWLLRIKGLKMVMLTHGEDIARLVLREKLRQELPDAKVIMPMANQEVNVSV